MKISMLIWQETDCFGSGDFNFFFRISLLVFYACTEQTYVEKNRYSCKDNFYVKYHDGVVRKGFIFSRLVLTQASSWANDHCTSLKGGFDKKSTRKADILIGRKLLSTWLVSRFLLLRGTSTPTGSCHSSIKK